MTERDMSLFPQDEIGDTLWEMLQQGDDLAQAREIEFSVIFSDKDSALKFGHFLLENNQKISFCPFPESKEFPWEVTAYPEVAASYENIMAYIDLLNSSSAPFSGKFDGWYSEPVATSTVH